ncbi:MAG: hypothetical protein K0Q81_742 [Paenibacillus sp.]|nr:hypothetical protein [Paenibacillus sp.]
MALDYSELFWNASMEELKRGYVQTDDHYISLLCGKTIEKGIIYPEDGVLYEAEKYMQVYIRKTHGSVFDYLTKLDKKLTGLTDHQNSLLRLFYQGKHDTEVQKELGIGSASTIRNHRFVLKEKERQSKVFLVMMELLKEKDDHAPAFVNLHQTAKMVDQRYNVTAAEKQRILQKAFPDGLDGPLKTFDLQEKHRYIVLREIAGRFQREHQYTEKETNEIIEPIYEDYAIIRRFLIEYGFMERKDDGSVYWLKT